jgi:anti-sigma factor RsiW
MTYEDLPCNDFVELTTEYLEGTLPLEERLVVERHLAHCAPCIDYLEQLRSVMHVAGELHEEDIPEPMMESLMDAFRALHGGHGPSAGNR